MLCPCSLDPATTQDDILDAMVPTVAAMSDEPAKAFGTGKLFCPAGDHFTPEPALGIGDHFTPKMHQPKAGIAATHETCFPAHSSQTAAHTPLADSSAMPMQSNGEQISCHTPIAKAASPPLVQRNRVQVSGLAADGNPAGIPNRTQSLSSKSLPSGPVRSTCVPNRIASSNAVLAPTKVNVSYEVHNALLPGALINRAASGSNVQSCSSEVTLHVYDLHQVTRMTGLPLFHLGIEIYKKEYFFSVDGIVSCPPAGHQKHVHKLTVPLGRANVSEQQVLQLLVEMGEEWHRGVYNLMSCNCQTFAIALCHRLGLGNCIPPQYCRLGDGGPKSQAVRSGMSWLHPILASTGSRR